MKLLANKEGKFEVPLLHPEASLVQGEAPHDPS